MKKSFIILSTIAFAFGISQVFAGEVNLPSAPSYGTPANINLSAPSDKYRKQTTTQTIPQIAPSIDKLQASDNSMKSQLDQIALEILHEAEKRNQAGVQANIKKMMDKGVNEMCQPQVIAKKTPTCPPIRVKINGIEKSGSLCAMTCYKYEGKEYEVGYCK